MLTTSDYITIANIVATVVAVLAAPLVALWIGGILQKRSLEHAEKMKLLSTLLSLRHQQFSADAVRSLNSVDAVFWKDREVREAWSRYFAALNDARNNNPAGHAQWDEKKRDLILAMTKNVGLEKYITTADILRTYQPTFIQKADQLSMLEIDIRKADAETRARNLKLPGYDSEPQMQRKAPKTFWRWFQ